MKKVYLLIAFLFLTQYSSFATQDTVNTDSTVKKTELSEKDTETVDSNTIADNAKQPNEAKKTPQGDTDEAITSKCGCISQDNDVGVAWILIFLPAIIFITIIIVLFRLQNGLKEFELTEALKENELTKVTVLNPHYTGQKVLVGETDVPTTIEITANVIAVQVVTLNPIASPPKSTTQYQIEAGKQTYRPSISRYIAFISSILIIIIAVCISCFFIYNYIKTGCPPELGALTAVLIALGIGIVPYAANKVSGAFAGNKSAG